MFDRRRWTWLGLFAAGNLALWVGIAYVAGLCAGDEVDLGVETLIRHAQATAVCSWEEVTGRDLPRMIGEGSTPLLRPRTPATATGVPLVLVTDGVFSLEGNEPPTVPVRETASPAEVEIPSTAAIASHGDETSMPVLVPPATVDQEPAATPPQPDPQVFAAPADAPADMAAASEIVTAPLLLVDPQFHTLAALNTEMERSAPGRPVQIRYQETALNREIATLCLNNPALPYRDVQVDLRDNGLTLSGRVTVLGFEVDAHLEGTIVARDCRPALEVDSVSLAGIMAPRFVRARVVAMAQESMTWYEADYPLCLEQIVLEETRATFYGHHR